MTKSQQQEWLVTLGEMQQRIQLLQAQINMSVPVDSQAFQQPAGPASEIGRPVNMTEEEQAKEQEERDAQATNTGEQSKNNVAE